MRHWLCDNCQQQMPAPTVTVEYDVDIGDDEHESRTSEFCSFGCLATWAMTEEFAT